MWRYRQRRCSFDITDRKLRLQLKKAGPHGCSGPIGGQSMPFHHCFWCRRSSALFDARSSTHLIICESDSVFRLNKAFSFECRAAKRSNERRELALRWNKGQTRYCNRLMLGTKSSVPILKMLCNLEQCLSHTCIWL